MNGSVNVPLDDVQGIILRGYETLESARFVLLTVLEREAARTWLGGIARELTPAQERPEESAVNIAFTCPGFKMLGLADEPFSNFSREFQEGMDTDHRRRVLGDPEEGSAQQLRWGGREDAKLLHVLLMLYAKDDVRLTQLYTDHRVRFEAGGLSERRHFDTIRLPDRKEHFGFRDGIAQPAVEGVSKPDPAPEGEPATPANTVRTGEILLGYPNEYGLLPPSPTVPAPDGRGSLDFGRNGSYLVFRQLSQDVRAFWEYIDQATASSGKTPEQHHAARLLLASKMVGRWPSGAPLALSADRDNPDLADANQYDFRDDPLGLKTPIGSHTRRSSPRDSLEPGPESQKRLTPEESIRVTRLHRIIRRGREYGKPIVASMDPGEILGSYATPPDTVNPGDIPGSPEPPADAERGLLFICFNANIARQFEFIQQTWVNNPKFGNLYQDTDPLMGPRQPVSMTIRADIFTEQALPVRRRYRGLSAFVRARGGGYFFMPGIEAVKYLAGLAARLESVTPVVPISSGGSTR